MLYSGNYALHPPYRACHKRNPDILPNLVRDARFIHSLLCRLCTLGGAPYNVLIYCFTLQDARIPLKRLQKHAICGISTYRRFNTHGLFYPFLCRRKRT